MSEISSADRIAMQRLVRHRLEAYHMDESIYSPRRATASHTGSRRRRPEQVPARMIRRVELDQAIARLPDLHRAAVLLRYVGEGFRFIDLLPLLSVSRRGFYYLLAEAIEILADDLYAQWSEGA